MEANQILQVLVGCVSAFLVGSFPTSYILVKIKTGSDIRTMGSGNIGATNVFRSVGWRLGLVVLLIDFLKGLIATTVIANAVDFAIVSTSSQQLIVGICAILGHVFTPFMKFKGGKGVATGAGVALGIYPLQFIISLFAWGIILRIWRYMSVASIGGAFTFAIACAFMINNYFHVAVTFGLAIFITWTHRANIKRLLRNEEIKFNVRR